MSQITSISIKNYRGIKELSQDFGAERFVVLIGRGDSGKSTILSAIYSALSPSWNMTFSDLDFYRQDTSHPIEIEVTLRELPIELLKEQKFALYIQNSLHNRVNNEDLTLVVRLMVDETLEPHWVVKARPGSDFDDKPISGADRSMLAVNCISDFTDNQFAYNRQSPLYALTKAQLDSGKTIERLKSELIRSMSQSTDNDVLDPLNTPLGDLTISARQLGLTVDTLCAKIDIKENPYTGNSISLHENSLPYRLHGKGSKRLMSIAIQSEMTKQGGIILVDELEQGLEPDRIITLVRKLKETQAGQVFITTHSLHVILEAEANNLFVLNKGHNTLAKVDSNLDSCRRTNPQAFFAKKIICCEGKTEQGFVRAIDKWIWDTYHTTLSAEGVVLVDAKGGDNMFTYALKLKTLGYDTCIFADDDKPKELASKKQKAIEAGIRLFLCEEGNCMERQLFTDLPWKYMLKVIDCNQDNFPHHNIKIPAELKEKIDCADDTTQDALRNDITNLSIMKDKEWFKHIPGGEFLGRMFMEAYSDVDDNKHMKQTVSNLLNWCGIKQ